MARLEYVRSGACFISKQGYFVIFLDKDVYQMLCDPLSLDIRNLHI